MPPAGPSSAAYEDAIYRKVTWRLVPFLMFCYLAAYLDRVNVGFAKLQMQSELGFSDTVFGYGLGIFFVGYFLFEVPSNLILHRVGARVWIARIMITWGLVSAAFLWVRTPFAFYGLRFLLGLAEAGFYPGIILYLTRWYPSHRRAGVVSLFMVAIPVSGVIGGPISGWIMSSLSQSSRLAGWQWLFLLEAVPSIVMGLVVLAYLDNGIRSARWLNDDERAVLERNLDASRQGVPEHRSIVAVLADGRVWLMCAIYFTLVVGQYGLTFWMPTLIQTAGVHGVLHIGLFTAIPYSAAVVVMLWLGRSADRRRERRWHVAGAMLVGACGLVLSAWAGTNTVVAMTGLTVAAAGVIAGAPLFWSLPTAFLEGAAAAAGIAAINSIGNLGGALGPSVFGRLEDYTHSTALGMYVIAGVVVLGALLVLSVPARLVNK